MFPIEIRRVELCTLTVESAKFSDGNAVLALAIDTQPELFNKLVLTKRLLYRSPQYTCSFAMDNSDM